MVIAIQPIEIPMKATEVAMEPIEIPIQQQPIYIGGQQSTEVAMQHIEVSIQQQPIQPIEIPVQRQPGEMSIQHAIHDSLSQPVPQSIQHPTQQPIHIGQQPTEGPIRQPNQHPVPQPTQLPVPKPIRQPSYPSQSAPQVTHISSLPLHTPNSTSSSIHHQPPLPVSVEPSSHQPQQIPLVRRPSLPIHTTLPHPQPIDIHKSRR